MTSCHYPLPIRLSNSFRNAIDYIFKNTISDKVVFVIKDNFIVIKYIVLNNTRDKHRSYLKAHNCETVSTVVSSETTVVRAVFGINNIIEQYFDYGLNLINSTIELFSRKEFNMFYGHLDALFYKK